MKTPQKHNNMHRFVISIKFPMEQYTTIPTLVWVQNWTISEVRVGNSQELIGSAPKTIQHLFRSKQMFTKNFSPIGQILLELSIHRQTDRHCDFNTSFFLKFCSIAAKKKGGKNRIKTLKQIIERIFPNSFQKTFH